MAETRVKKAAFHFLGKRDYVQAGSIIDELLAAAAEWEIGEPSRINAAFHHLLSENGDFVLIGTGMGISLREEGYCARFRVLTSIDDFLIGLRGTDEKIKQSVPYDEDKFLDGYHTKPGAASSGHVTIKRGGSPFKTLVALTKRLHEEFFPLEGHQRWIVSGFDLQWGSMWVDEYEERALTVRLTSGVRGGFTRSSVEVEKDKVGYIVFTRVEKT